MKVEHDIGDTSARLATLYCNLLRKEGLRARISTDCIVISVPKEYVKAKKLFKELR